MKRLLPLLLALLLPACRGTGAEGIDPPVVIDMSRITRPSTPNTALAAPAGFSPAPDVVTPRYPVDPDRLFAVIRTVALAQANTVAHGDVGVPRQAHFVARSALMKYPDLIAVQVTPDADLILWSRSIYGRSDFGVNQARLMAWLAALDAALAAP